MTPNRILYLCCVLILADPLMRASATTRPDDTQHLHLAGYVFMEPIGTRRILVALASQPDGAVEHVFLYTAAKDLSVTLGAQVTPHWRKGARVTPQWRNVAATLDYESGSELKVKPTQIGAGVVEFIEHSSAIAPAVEGSTTRYSETVGLSHFVASPPLKYSDVEAAHLTSDCDSAPKSCLQAGGHYLPFAD